MHASCDGAADLHVLAIASFLGRPSCATTPLVLAVGFRSLSLLSAVLIDLALAASPIRVRRATDMIVRGSKRAMPYP